MGTLSRFLFWYDPWVDWTHLLRQFHPTIISLAKSTQLAEVGNYIQNGSWSLPSSNHPWIVELRRQVSSICIARNDTIQWDGQPAHLMNLSMIWQTIRARGSTPLWIHSVWNNLSIPKCSFTFWLALKNRLLTKERMSRFGMNTDVRCVLCDNATETNDQIFSSCSYVTEVISGTGFSFTMDWTSFLNGQFIMGGNSGMKKLLSFLYFVVTG